MRWKTERIQNKTRVKTFFAFIPVRCKKENRWLEMVTVTQEYIDKKWVSTSFKDDGK